MSPAKQYEFRISKQGWRTHSVLCTARTIEDAARAVRAAYAPEFNVARTEMVYDAHHFYGEIDATA